MGSCHSEAVGVKVEVTKNVREPEAVIILVGA
jgi:hypothetical protein